MEMITHIHDLQVLYLYNEYLKYVFVWKRNDMDQMNLKMGKISGIRKVEPKHVYVHI